MQPVLNPENEYLTGHFDDMIETMSRRTVANSAAYLQSSLRPHMKVLDVGCGPGGITIDLAKYVPRGHATGLDTSTAAAALEKARAEAVAEGVTNIDFVVGDVVSLPFPDATFDVVHGHQVIQHLKDPVQGLREMRRVTKPGGLVACRESDGATFIWYPDFEGMTQLRTAFERIARDHGAEPDAGRRLHAWAREAGFDSASIRTSASCWRFQKPEERKLWGSTFVGMCSGSEYSKLVLSRGEATEEGLQTMAAGWKKWMDCEDGWSAIMHGEILCRV